MAPGLSPRSAVLHRISFSYLNPHHQFVNNLMPSFSQNIVPDFPTVDYTVVPVNRTRFEKLLLCLQQQRDQFWGVSAILKDNGRIKSFSLATSEGVFVLGDVQSLTKKHLDRLWSICGDDLLLVGFNMDSISLGFYRTFNTRFSAVDLGVVYRADREQSHPVSVIQKLYPASSSDAGLQSMWAQQNYHQELNVCMRAWISLRIAKLNPKIVQNGSRIDLKRFTTSELALISTFYLQHELLEQAKPLTTCAEFSKYSSDNGKFELENSRYKTRMRPNVKGHLIFQDSTGKTIKGRSMRICGKTTHGVVHGNMKGPVKSITIVGKDRPTYAEDEQITLLLNVLLGNCVLRKSYYTRVIWKLTNPEKKARRVPALLGPTSPLVNRLNDSQKMALASMLSSDEIVLVHGPPGTGKTTVISAAAKAWDQANEPVWIVAHSNVAVKNIAEKLFKDGVDFKLLVSHDFYKEWHEDIYTMIESYLLRSDQFPKDKTSLSQTLGATEIILCTLSMISHPLLKANGMFECVPIKRLIVDEASQINIFEYLPIFTRFRKTLRKVCFFGDPNQLPPFRQDQVSSMRSIFDIKHLSEGSLFLREQYRMPVPVGDFISQEVYQNRLLSRHSIVSASCVAFVDAPGTEELKRGSYVNRKEVQSIVHLVRHYYCDKEYRIITPYDAQRAAIIESLKAVNLPSDRVFNVDSFQGNESDYVLISVVRNQKIGFLSSDNRINVMLTRAKKGMVIVANQGFIDGLAKKTLLGKMSAHWLHNHASSRWIKWSEVADKKAKLPGVAIRGGQ